MVIVTDIHDSIALAQTCRRCNVPVPRKGSTRLGDRDVSGWIVFLPGCRFPMVCDTLTGLVSYHPADNSFLAYRCIMRWIHRFYAVRHTMSHVQSASITSAVYRFPRQTADRRRLISEAV